MDMKKGKNDNLWKYLLGIGAGLGVGYLAYKTLFSNSNNNHSLDSLSRYEAEQRSSILSDINYNLYLKMKHLHEEINHPLQHHKAAVKGLVEIEFNLSQTRDLCLEFGGYVLEILRVVAGKKEKLKISHDRESKKILIEKSNLIKGKNKLIINFYLKEYEKGLVYSDQIYFTDFQPFGAHHLFPCFDQPDLKSEIDLFLAIPKSMEAFGVTDHNSIDLIHYNDSGIPNLELEQYLEITDKNEFKYLQFKTTPKLPLYSFFFCAGDLKAYEFNNNQKKIVQRIVVPTNRNDISIETQNTIFSFTEIFLDHFKKSINIDYFPCEFINHIFLPHAIEMREKINQIYGHSITLKWWDDFWFKESLSIFLAYHFNYKISQIDVQEKKQKKEIIDTFEEIEDIKDTWNMFIKFNSKAYTFDRNNRKNHPVIKEIDYTDEVYKIKDEMTYCKGPAIIKYLCYALGEEVFFGMVKNFISSFKDSTASYKDFLSMLDKCVTNNEQNKNLKNKIENINEDFLKKTCPPVYGYEIITEENTNKVKNVYIKEEKIDGIDNTPSNLETDILFVYLNKSSSSDFGSSTSVKYVKFTNVDLKNQEKINEKLKCDESKPDFILLNYTDNSYLIQKFTSDQCEWLIDNLEYIKDSLILSVIVRNLKMMTFNRLFSPRKLINLLTDLLSNKNNIFNIDYFLKTIIFLINEFVPNELHQKDYKTKLFDTIADTLAKTDSLKCLYNVFIRHLIDCTDRHNKEELVKLIEYIASGHIPQAKGFSRRQSGVPNLDFNDFKIEDLLKLPDNISEKITQENLKRLLILILESDVVEEEFNSTMNFNGNPLRAVQLKSLKDVGDLLMIKFYKGNCSDEIKTKVDTILDPHKAWIKTVNISNSKFYLVTHNWILERLLKPKQLTKIGFYNYETFLQIIENSLANDNLDFLERFIKYSEGTFAANEDSIKLYYTCAKKVENHRNKKNDKKVEKINHMLFNIHNHILKKLDIMDKYEKLWSGKDENIQNSLDNSNTYGN